MSPVTTYRIGWRTGRDFWFTLSRRWHRLRKHGWRHPAFGLSAFHPKRIVHRPWQAEITLPDCHCNARRALTQDGAARRVWRAHLRAATAGRCAA
jgi:hypothetical protein